MNFFRLLSLGMLIAFVYSCTKNKLGGSSTIHGKVAHHEKTITNATVFIKFNAKEFPGEDTTKYDAKMRVNAAGEYYFNCYKGQYYLYSVGVDKGVPPPYRVTGGIPVTIRNNENRLANLPVTE